ncbi:hypothetical protein AKO1_013651 [Acrasis kona]|uniref:MPN domain-containing protein n=1 Tax=Acrasis kona TaxID=1008807 RepID=A0AAW2YU78_9EUKA
MEGKNGVLKKRERIETAKDDESSQSDDSDYEDDEAENVLPDETQDNKRIRFETQTFGEAGTYNMSLSRCCRGDFSNDNSLCDMVHEESVNHNNKPYSVVVDQSVLAGILDHVYSDHVNEVIGMLGGHFNEELNIVHVRHYYACIRDVENIAVDGVECDENEFVRASILFSENNMNFMGWYHSHPRIPPFPSMKDLAMQREMQSQAPCAFGIICSAYFNESAHRTSENGDMEAVKVMCSINEQVHLTSQAQRQIHSTLKTVFEETKETFKHLYKSDRLEKQLFLVSQYQSFLTSFWKDSICHKAAALRCDLRNIRNHNDTLRQLIQEKKNLLSTLQLGTKDQIMEKQDDDRSEQEILEIGRVVNSHFSSRNITSQSSQSNTVTDSDAPFMDMNDPSVQLLSMMNNNSSSFFLMDGPLTKYGDCFYYEKFCLNHEVYKVEEVISFQQEGALEFAKITHIFVHERYQNATNEQQYDNLCIWGESLATPKRLNATEEYDGELIYLKGEKKTFLVSLVNIAKVHVYSYETYIQKKFGEDQGFDKAPIYGCSRQIDFKTQTIEPLTETAFP